MAWAAGTDTTGKLKTILAEWLKAKFASAPVKARLPRRSIKIAAPIGSEKISGSIKVLLYTGPDEAPPHKYKKDGKWLLEEFHRITIDVQSDEKGARANEDTQVAGVIRQLVASPSECAALNALGIYDVGETMDALQLDGVEFSRPINFTCNTDVILEEID